MAHGLQVYNSSGGLIHDVSDRLTRYIGSLVISGSGSINVPDFALGEGWYFATPENTYSSLTSFPSVTISGTTISWSTSGGNQSSITIHYGVY